MRNSAFTLIEVLLVIAIIGILSTLALSQLGGSRTRALNSSAQADIATAGKSIEVWRVVRGIAIDQRENALAERDTQAPDPGDRSGSETWLRGGVANGSWNTFLSSTATSPDSYGTGLRQTANRSTLYMYQYNTSEDTKASNSGGYCLSTNLQRVNGFGNRGFYIENGSSAFTVDPIVFDRANLCS